MYKKINELQPHFFSLRELKNSFSLDILIMVNWTFAPIVTKYEGVSAKIQDQSEKTNLISLMANATEVGFENIFNCGLEIIQYNKEIEEKHRLFLIKEEEIKQKYLSKIEKLKNIFEKEPLDKLKQINIDFNETEEHEQSIIEQGNIVITDGDEEGSKTIGTNKIETD